VVGVHARPLPDGYAYTWSVLGPAVKDALCLVQAAACEQQFGYALTVARPLLNLVALNHGVQAVHTEGSAFTSSQREAFSAIR